eukprot:gene1778-2916_t
MTADSSPKLFRLSDDALAYLGRYLYWVFMVMFLFNLQAMPRAAAAACLILHPTSVPVAAPLQLITYRWGLYSPQHGQLHTEHCPQISNIAAIVESSQDTDYTLITIFGRSCGLQLYRSAYQGIECNATSPDDPCGGDPRLANSTDAEGPRFHCITREAIAGTNLNDSPFGYPSDEWVISIGFVVLLLLCIPLGYINLEDNMFVQVGAFLVMAVFIQFMWMAYGVYLIEEKDLLLPKYQPKLPAPASANMASQLGQIFFNYAFVITVPSWVNEMKPGVSVNKSIWWSLTFGIFSFVGIGFLAGYFTSVSCQIQLPAFQMLMRHRWALYNNCGETDDLLAKLSDTGIFFDTKKPDPDQQYLHHKVSAIACMALDTLHAPTYRLLHQYWDASTKVATFLFPWAALVSGIPIMSIIIRYNLLEANICGKAVANFWAVLFPWAAALALYAGDFLDFLTNWGGNLCVVPLNFILPCILWILARKERQHAGFSTGTPTSSPTAS